MNLIAQATTSSGSLPRILDIAPFIWVPLAVLSTCALLLIVFGKVPITYVLGNLAVRWRTTFMTALAFSLVILLLTVMLAFVNGMYALTKGSGHEENVIILSEGSTDEGFSNLGYGDVGDIENQPGISRDSSDKPLLSRETYLTVNQLIENAAAGRPKRRFLQLRGVDDPVVSSQVHELPLHPGGEWFSEAGVRDIPGAKNGETAIEVVMGEGIARAMALDPVPVPGNIFSDLADRVGRYFGFIKPTAPLAVGDTFRLNDRTWYITGIMRSSGSTFDSELWGKRSLLGPIFGKETHSTLVARTADAAQARVVKDYFNKDYSKSAVAAQVETDYFASLSETNKQFLFAIGFVTIFMSIGGVFGVMNTMFAAISQRIKDIGVLRLLGFGRRHILATFLLESVAIAIVGGVIGCLLGLLCDGVTANSIVSSGQGGGKFVVLQLTVDNQTLAIGMLLTLFMGFLGGLIPSLRAMQWTALETLR